jgi:hypothetical protein
LHDALTAVCYIVAAFETLVVFLVIPDKGGAVCDIMHTFEAISGIWIYLKDRGRHALVAMNGLVRIEDACRAVDNEVTAAETFCFRRV